MAEKREIKRHKKQLTLRFGILAFSADISANGIFIKTPNITPPGTIIMIELTLPDNEKVTFEGIVRWTKKVPPRLIHLENKCGMGVEIIQFITGEASYQQFIANCENGSISVAFYE
jgi:Tfp pilus assembly protein PilZ